MADNLRVCNLLSACEIADLMELEQGWSLPVKCRDRYGRMLEAHAELVNRMSEIVPALATERRPWSPIESQRAETLDSWSWCEIQRIRAMDLSDGLTLNGTLSAVA